MKVKPYDHVRYVAWEDCDLNRSLRPSSLLTYFQDAAVLHIEHLGFPYSYTSSRNAFWVIAKQKIEILRMPHYGETVTVRTYPGQRLKYLFPRHYELVDSSKKVIARGTAIWTLIHGDTRSFVEPSSIGLEIPSIAKGNEVSASFSTLAEGLDRHASAKATWSLCDSNRHMNNVKYLDAAEDAMELSFLMENECRSIEIVYRKEVKLGEAVELEFGNQNGTWTFVCPAFFLRLAYAKRLS